MTAGDPDDEDLIGDVGHGNPATGLDEVSARIKADWAARRAAEESGREYAAELLAQPEAVVRSALYNLAGQSPRLYTIAQYGPSQEALDVEKEVQRLRVRKEAKSQFDQESRTLPEAPPLVNLTAFLDDPDEDVRYRVEGLWPVEGRIVLAAQNKSGKTTLTGNLIRSLVDGDDFLDHFAVEPVRRVVLLDNEMSPSQMRRWLRDQGIRNTDAVDVVSLRGKLSSFNILDPEIRAEWAARIGPADVLLFDCLRPALDALGLSEDKDAGRFLEALDELVAASLIPELFLIHHMGHSNERSRGDSRLEDWPDAKWKIVKESADDPDSPRYFSAFGRDVDQPERRLAYEHDTRHLSVDGGSRKQATTSRIEDTVLLFIGGNPGCGMNDIRDNVDGDRETIRRVVKASIARGSVRMVRIGQKHAHYLSEDVPEKSRIREEGYQADRAEPGCQPGQPGEPVNRAGGLL